MSKGQSGSMLAGWRSSEVLHMSAATEPTRTSSHGNACHPSRAPPSRYARHVPGSTKARQCSDQTLAISPGETRCAVVTVVGIAPLVPTYDLVCGTHSSTYGTV